VMAKSSKKAGRLNREGPQLSTANRRQFSLRCLQASSKLPTITARWTQEALEATPYHSGNSEPKGFGHIVITVANVEEACAHFERLGVPFKKRTAG
jgi:hypothetical protein